MVTTARRVGATDAPVTEFLEAVLANSWHTNVAIMRATSAIDEMSLAAGLAHEHCCYTGKAPDHEERIARLARNCAAASVRGV